MSASQTVDRAIALDPDLVAEVAGVAGARDGDGNVADRRLDEAEVFERVEIRRRQLLRGSRERSDLEAPAPRASSETSSIFTCRPTAFIDSQRRFGSALVSRKVAIVEAADGAVVDHFAVARRTTVYKTPGRRRTS